ncbi:MAG: sugar phosphate isomerase/epimerase [Verrucomicrobia bacterium]|nr:MAG: sugar phosphate isomerase/epimerase [Verrucomicrobiota bacterium]
MKFAICNEIFDGWSLADTFAFARKAGYDAVELAPFTLGGPVTTIDAARRREIRGQAAAAGIAISGIHWVLVKTEGLHLTSPDEAVRARTARYFVELVDFCADVGGKFMVVGSPKQRQLLAGVTLPMGWQWAAEVFAPAVRRAEERGVTICFEPLAPSETNFVNTAAEAIRFARGFGSRAMSVILDVKAMSSEASPVPEVIRASRGGFAYFHANDSNLKGPGFGAVDFRPIGAALRAVGYDGYVSVEVFKFEEGAEAIATRSRAYLREAFGE